MCNFDVKARTALLEQIMRYLFFILVLSSVTAAGRVEGAAMTQTCAAKTGGQATVTEIFDHETLVLDDARVVRMSGIHMPVLTPRSGAILNPAAVIKTALTTWVLGQRVELFYEAERLDRYGRHMAQIALQKAGKSVWLQARLVEEGLALTGAGGNVTCAGQLLQHEQQARLQARGFWGGGLFRIRRADAAKLMRPLVNSFQLVEGRVVNVSEKNGSVYINFGENWKTDFTAAIYRRNLARLRQHVKSFQSLVRRTVRVRGWIEWRNGPLIELSAPHQIEIEEEGNGDRPALPSNPAIVN